MMIIAGASKEEGSHRYWLQGRAFFASRMILCPCEIAADCRLDRRSGMESRGEAVLERSRRMWCNGQALFVSTEGGAGPMSSGELATVAHLLDLPARVFCMCSRLQNALRRLFLSMTLYSNPPLPLSSQPVAAQVPRGPPRRRCDMGTRAFWSRASARKALSP